MKEQWSFISGVRFCFFYLLFRGLRLRVNIIRLLQHTEQTATYADQTAIYNDIAARQKALNKGWAALWAREDDERASEAKA